MINFGGANSPSLIIMLSFNPYELTQTPFSRSHVAYQLVMEWYLSIQTEDDLKS